MSQQNKKASWPGGFKVTVISKPGSTLSVTKIELPKTIRDAISDSLQVNTKSKSGSNK